MGLRTKGSSTAEPLDGKPGLKVKLDAYVDGQSWGGVRAFNLHNSSLDPSMMRESIAYWLYRTAGLPAPRTGYAAVTLRGDYRGLYTVVEQKDRDFVAAWFASEDGSLYEDEMLNCDLDQRTPGGTRCTCFEADLEGSHDSRADLEQLCAAAVVDDDDAWLAAMQDKLAWDRMIGTLMMDTVIAHADGYTATNHNYHLYHDPALDKWTLSPWSMDLAFGWWPWPWPESDSCGELSALPNGPDSGLLAARCWEIPACRADMEERLLGFADLIETVGAVARVAQIRALVEPHVSQEVYWVYDADAFDRHAGCIASFLAARPDQIRAGEAF